MGKHLRNILAWATIGASILLGSCSSNSAIKGTGEAGFSLAYFSTTDLNAVLRDTECVRVRFYNARRTASDTKGSVIMIGVRADTTELNRSSTYKLYDRLTSGMVATISLAKEDARRCCLYLPASQKRYCAEFSREEVTRILTAAGCGGIQLVPKKTPRGFLSMEMAPVKFSGTTATVLTSVPPILCMSPCPDICGPMIDYINY